MSTQVLPSLVGQGISVTRTTMTKTLLQESISGKESAIALWTYPRYTWEVTFNVLRAKSTLLEYQQLLDFFNSRQGQFDTFLYQDPDDNTVTGGSIGTGNGSTAAYQLIRQIYSGGFLEPIFAPHNVSAVYLNSVSIPSAGYSAPGVPSLSNSAGGSLGATTYYVKCTWVTNSGETLPGTEANLAVGANNVLKVTQPASPPAGAVSWNIYVSNTAGGGSGAETVQATVAIGTTTWTEPTSGLVAGAALPGANTTGWSVSNWGTSSPGVLTFQGNVVNSIPITADFTYYFPVRMTSDSLAFEQFLSKYYKIKKFSFKSVKV